MVRHGLVDIPISAFNKTKAVNYLLVAEVVITRTLALESFYKGPGVILQRNQLSWSW